MIWVKRAIPILLIVAAVLAYQHFQQQEEAEATRLVEQYALPTAQVWLASGHYRDLPAKFVAFRDSLLSEHDLTPQQMIDFLDIYRDQPERYLAFAARVTQLVDSLNQVRESFLPMKAS